MMLLPYLLFTRLAPPRAVGIVTMRSFADEKHLRAAFARERPYRPHWPDTYESAAADPIILRVLDMLARHVEPPHQRRRWAFEGVQQSLQAPPEAPPPMPPEWGPARPALDGMRVPDSMRRPALDNKSRAAGEREEPDD